MKSESKLTSNILAVLSLSILLSYPAQAANDSRQARYAPAPSAVMPQAMEPKNVPDFASGGQGSTEGTAGTRIPTQNGGQQSGAALRADAASTTLPVSTHLRLVLETIVDAKTSTPGDIFEAHVKDDLFIGTVLLLPKGSLVRGRVAEVTKPRLLSRAAKIGLKLEQIVTPQGEVIPLDAALEFQKGLTNNRGQLDPGTNFGTRVESNVKSVTGMNSTGTARGALIAANVATLGAPAIATAIGSSAIAIFKAGDNVSLSPGQELEVQLTNDLGLQLN
ncbi:MAG TPA: hypothetical protein PLY72_03835 [Candidatus Obscuribacter sp.]|nr:hypothetical protein [Candidatus Obscuribacter sp.]HND06857.1 hypothetical protein [Candidatus Obscuribacter sp.]HNG73558.1 hypothetical protein [Candidatus Obscuribacter sp.]